MGSGVFSRFPSAGDTAACPKVLPPMGNEKRLPTPSGCAAGSGDRAKRHMEIASVLRYKEKR
jgi:hypothetical protein